MISSPVFESRFPVGSSASRMLGWLTRARATATRWRCPPDSSAGRWSLRSPSPTASSAADGALAPFLGRHAGVDQRQLDVVQGAGAREQVERLEDEADLLVADPGQLGVGQVRHALPVEPVLARRGRVEAADHVHQRALAGPGRPHDRDEFVAVDVEVDAAQRLDHFGAEHVVARQRPVRMTGPSSAVGSALRPAAGAWRAAAVTARAPRTPRAGPGRSGSCTAPGPGPPRPGWSRHFGGQHVHDGRCAEPVALALHPQVLLRGGHRVRETSICWPAASSAVSACVRLASSDSRASR